MYGSKCTNTDNNEKNCSKVQRGALGFIFFQYYNEKLCDEKVKQFAEKCQNDKGEIMSPFYPINPDGRYVFG